MLRLNTSLTMLGATAALAFGASLSAAQATSQQRIKITKSASGEVVRVDTVYVPVTLTKTKTDTVVVEHTRTVTNTVTQVETTVVTLPPLPLPLVYPQGVYVGIAGGVSEPAGSLYNPNNTGPSGQLQVGYQNISFPLGLRVDVNYLRPAHDAGYAAINDNANASFWNFNGDLKLALPRLGNEMAGVSRRFSFYALGGVSYSTFNNALIELNAGTPGTAGAANVASAPNWQHEWGWNAGGGGSMDVGQAQLFLESRVIAFNPTNSHQARQIPIVFGLNWFPGTISK